MGCSTDYPYHRSDLHHHRGASLPSPLVSASILVWMYHCFWPFFSFSFSSLKHCYTGTGTVTTAHYCSSHHHADASSLNPIFELYLCMDVPLLLVFFSLLFWLFVFWYIFCFNVFLWMLPLASFPTPKILVHGLRTNHLHEIHDGSNLIEMKSMLVDHIIQIWLLFFSLFVGS